MCCGMVEWRVVLRSLVQTYCEDCERWPPTRDPLGNARAIALRAKIGQAFLSELASFDVFREQTRRRYAHSREAGSLLAQSAAVS